MGGTCHSESLADTEFPICPFEHRAAECHECQSSARWEHSCTGEVGSAGRTDLGRGFLRRSKDFVEDVGGDGRVLVVAHADGWHLLVVGTFLARKIKPHKQHVITLRDPRGWSDWRVEFNFPSSSRVQVVKNWLYEDNPFVHYAVRTADGVYAASQTAASRGQVKYKLAAPLNILPTPVVLPDATEAQVVAFAEEHNQDGKRPVIGMASRFATEKGVEILLDAMPRVLEVFPNAMVQFAGSYQNIIGEEAYYERLYPRIDAYQEEGRWKFMGNLAPEQMARFYPNLDVLVMPSLNSTEAFGLVQIEAMMNGTPSIASALPGVRQPVMRHSMGEVVPIGDSAALAEALIRVLSEPEKHQQDPEPIMTEYKPDTIASTYEALFDEMYQEIGKRKPGG